MSAPTQELPSWLTYIATTVTVDGTPIPTSTLVYLPLTYYGPSIPLGSLWTFGGSTSPASTSTSPTSSSTLLSVTTSATPSSLSATPSSISATPSSISATPSSTTSNPLSSSSSSSSPSLSSSSSSPFASNSSTATAVSAPHTGLQRDALIGVIVACIIGVIFIFMAVLVVLLIRSTRRRRREALEQWEILGTDGRPAGEGSPRHSGEESDPFLQPRSGPNMQQSGPGNPVTLANVAPQSNSPNNSASSRGSAVGSSGSSAILGHYGTELPRSERRGPILSQEELSFQLGDEPRPNTDFGPSMPPRLVASSGPSAYRNLSPLPPMAEEMYGNHGPRAELSSGNSEVSISPSLKEEEINQPAVMLARRVRVPSQDTDDRQGPSNRPISWKNLGIGALADLARRSWFGNDPSGSSSKRNSRVPSFVATGLTDGDMEAGRALLSGGEPSGTGSGRHSPLLPPRRPGVGLTASGDRPDSGVSGVSARSTSGGSGTSVYHDADSSLPSTPLQPPPRALALPQFPPAYDDGSTLASDQPFDVLDTAPPRGISPFASLSSLQASSTASSSLGQKRFPYPPGLVTAIPTPKVWGDTSGTTPSVGSFGAESAGNRQSTAITFDILESEPPAAPEGWRSLTGGAPDERRTTFGMPSVMRTPDYTSDQGSLHSMRSYLSPSSSRSGGSGSVSRRDASGSTASRSSENGGHSLTHSNSISSDGRRHGRGPGPRSPALSAFGEGPMSRPVSRVPPMSPMTPMFEDVAVESSLAAPPHLPFSHIPAVIPEGFVAVDGGSRGPSRSTSPVLSTTGVPWATGLDHDWRAS
ncbi:hypothetical protein C8J56DRAFT_1166186 [Mycena floridula]|nr:hypothetical protein C8J56DRAFT_1166186 [Mycena floridula]